MHQLILVRMVDIQTYSYIHFPESLLKQTLMLMNISTFEVVKFVWFDPPLCWVYLDMATSNPKHRCQFQRGKALPQGSRWVARVQLGSSMMRRLGWTLGRCLEHNSCVSMLNATTPYLSLSDFGWNAHGELWKEGKLSVVNKIPKCHRQRTLLNWFIMSQSVFKKKVKQVLCIQATAKPSLLSWEVLSVMQWLKFSFSSSWGL